MLDHRYSISVREGELILGVALATLVYAVWAFEQSRAAHEEASRAHVSAKLARDEIAERVSEDSDE